MVVRDRDPLAPDRETVADAARAAEMRLNGAIAAARRKIGAIGRAPARRVDIAAARRKKRRRAVATVAIRRDPTRDLVMNARRKQAHRKRQRPRMILLLPLPVTLQRTLLLITRNKTQLLLL
jgi:hypothetical protein